MSDALAQKLAELARRFVDQAVNQSAAIRDALQRGDKVELATLAHKLAGNAGMLGFPDVGEAALEVEERIDEGADPREATERLLGLLSTL